MTTSITRPPGTDVRTTAERQEAALLAAFRYLSQAGRTKLMRQTKQIVEGEKRKMLFILKRKP